MRQDSLVNDALEGEETCAVILALVAGLSKVHKLQPQAT